MHQKFRACEIIDELEKEPRGVYGGAIGYIDLSGNLDVCIAIRTAIKKEIKYMFRQVQELLQTVYLKVNIWNVLIKQGQ